MIRIMLVMFALVSMMWLSATAMAQQPTTMSDCNQWINKIHAEADDRVDEAGWTARQRVDDIARMCKEGKMAEAQKTASDTMTLLGIKM
jgi:hypothetical protein